MKIFFKGLIPCISDVSGGKANGGLVKIVDQVDVWINLQRELQIAGPRDRV